MSTKISLATDDQWLHVFVDSFDEERNVVIQYGMEGEEVVLPAYVWEKIRQVQTVSLDLLYKTDAELQVIVERNVDRRLAAYEAALKSGDENARILAMMTGDCEWDDPEQSRQEWIFAGLKRLSLQRDKLRAFVEKSKQVQTYPYTSPADWWREDDVTPSGVV